MRVTWSRSFSPTVASRDPSGGFDACGPRVLDCDRWSMGRGGRICRVFRGFPKCGQLRVFARIRVFHRVCAAGAARRHGGGRRSRLARRTRDAPAWCQHRHDVGRGDAGMLVCRVASRRPGPGRVSRHACANCSPHDQRNGATQKPLCITCTFRRDGTQELGGRMSLTLARKKKKRCQGQFLCLTVCESIGFQQPIRRTNSSEDVMAAINPSRSKGLTMRTDC